MLARVVAHMIPEEPRWDAPGAAAERTLFEALRAELDDEYFVYHRLGVLDRVRAREGEADFVVLHREHGLLVVECKGGGVRRTGTGRWLRVCPEGREEELAESPFAQAQRHVKALVGELEARLPRLFPECGGRLPLTHGHAVAFPFVRTDGSLLPVDVPRTLLLDSDDLSRLGARVPEILAFWRGGHAPRAPLDASQLRRFRKQLLHPRLRLVPSLGGRVEAERRTLLRLTEEQVAVVRGLLGNRRLVVSGGAGTGKTVLAVEAARDRASRGEDVLLLCFNAALCDHLRATVAAFADEVEGRVLVTTFHRLCFSAFHALGEEPKPPPASDAEASSRFWNRTAPDRLLDALAADLVPRWDAVVVDEGQDFAAEWWPLVEECLRDRESGRLLMFHDRAQAIFDRVPGQPESAALFFLTCNLRNTRRIAEVVQRLGGVEMSPHPGCPEGEPPTTHVQDKAARVRSRLAQLVVRMTTEDGLRPEQITILTPHSRGNSTLAGLAELAGLRLADDPTDRGGALLHTTIGKFKGLESDVVVLLDIDPEDPRCGRQARYVAASRACHRLHVFAAGDWLDLGADG